MRYSTMEKKGDAQLSAKRQLVSDQLEVAKDHLETLRTKCNLVELHSKRICDFVSDTFTDLKHSLDKKEKEVVSRILVDSSRIKEELSTAKNSAELIIERSRQVRSKLLCIIKCDTLWFPQVNIKPPPPSPVNFVLLLMFM